MAEATRLSAPDDHHGREASDINRVIALNFHQSLPPSASGHDAHRDTVSQVTGGELEHDATSTRSGLPTISEFQPGAAARRTPDQESSESPRLTATGPSLVVDESSALWKQAYEELRKDKPVLVEEYEMVLKDQANIPQIDRLMDVDKLRAVARAQRRKAESKQWTFQWFGQPQVVRDTVEKILNITSKSASLVSIGMNQAPPYVSIPWSAITALIPLMMNDIKEHKGCILGLEIVA